MGYVGAMTDDAGNVMTYAKWLEAQNQKAQPGERRRTVAETLQAMASEKRGKELAKQAARDRETERKLREPQRPMNEYALILEKGLHPDLSHKRKELERLSKAKEKAIDAQLAEQARREAIANDPATKIAVENAQFVIQAAPEDLKGEAMENLAIAHEGSHELYWQRTRELEQKMFDALDRETAAKLAARESTSKEFSSAAEQLAAAQERLANANTMAGQ